MTRLTRADITELLEHAEKQGYTDWVPIRDLATTCLSMMDERDRAIDNATRQITGTLRTAEARIRDLEEGLREMVEHYDGAIHADPKLVVKRLRALLTERDDGPCGCGERRSGDGVVHRVGAPCYQREQAEKTQEEKDIELLISGMF